MTDEEWRAYWAEHWSKQDEIPCPNLDCFQGMVDDLTQPRGCPCCTYVMIDCPVCKGEGMIPNPALDTAPFEPVGSYS